jgi:2-methylisocitrate lyase-like PEP mutase family enzyme
VGVAGVHIEDEIPPKHTAWDGPLLPVVDMQARIEAAVDARRDDDFVVIVRTDELYAQGGGGGGSLDEAIRRGIAYAEAGADAFLPTFIAAEDIPRVAAEVPIPIVAYGPLSEGLTFSLYIGWGVAAAAGAHHHWATHLMEHGDLPTDAFGIPDKDELIDQPRYDEVVRRWAVRTGRPVR